MTVQQLIELLEEQDPSLEVILSKDPEGNKYSTLEDFSVGLFNNKYSTFTPEEENFSEFYYNDDESDEEDESLGIPCVCLWPSY